MAKLEKSLAALKVGVEVEKTTASLAYFQERSEELFAMGVELLIEGRTAGWAWCKERMLALITAKLPKLDTALIDSDLATVGGIVDGSSVGGLSDPVGCPDEQSKGALPNLEGR